MLGQRIPINRPNSSIKFLRVYELRGVRNKLTSKPEMLLLKNKKEIARYTEDYDFYLDLASKVEYNVESEYKWLSQVGPKIQHPSIPEAHYFNYNHPLGMVAGFCKRVAHKIEFDPDELKKFKSFVQSFIHKNYRPVQHLDVTHENMDKYWLDGSKYSLKKKQLFHDALEDYLTIGKSRDFYNCSSFIKKENYPEYKYPRIINSRSDQFKAVVAPLIHLIEEQVCVNEHTIKHKEKHQFTQRMLEIQDKFGRVYETDYSSFEGSYSPEFQAVCEKELLMWMLSDNLEVKKVVRHVYTHPNKCYWKGGCATIPGSRMSGDMWTSSMNGFTNRMLFEYTVSQNAKAQQAPIDYDFIVEGDDGMMGTSRSIDLSYVTKLGFKLKINIAEDLNDLSFCGINVCDGKYVPDVPRTLAGLTFSTDPGTAQSERRRKEMVYARGLSLMVESSGIPILQDLAVKLLSIGSTHYKVRDIDWWYLHNMFKSDDLLIGTNAFIKRYHSPVTLGMRRFVETKYKIPIRDQYYIESKIKDITLDQILNSTCYISVA